MNNPRQRRGHRNNRPFGVKGFSRRGPNSMLKAIAELARLFLGLASQRILSQIRSSRNKFWIHLAVFSLFGVGLALPGFTQGSPVQSDATLSAPALTQQGQEFYEAGQFNQAIQVLQQALQTYQAEGNTLRQALTLSNLSLAYQQLGAWPEATQSITESLNLLRSPSLDQVPNRDRLLVLAQALDIQGRLWLAQGQSTEALTAWEEATATYEQVDDEQGVIDSQINQAQALQALGLYRRAIALLTEVNTALTSQPDSLTKALALRSLGDALLVAGDSTQARQVLEQSLQIVTRLESQDVAAGNPSNPAIQEAIAATQLSLGNLVRIQAASQLSLNGMTIGEAVGQLNTPVTPNINAIELAVERRQTQAAQAFLEQIETALNYYQTAATNANSSQTHIQALLNQLNMLVELERWAIAQSLYPAIQTAIDDLPVSRNQIYHQISLARSLMKLQQGTQNAPVSEAGIDISRLLATAHQNALTLGDRRAQSYALGNLAELYEKNHQWSDAQTVTQQALGLSQAIAAADISYRWQWQLGRLLKQQGDEQGAIAAYSEAVSTLQSLRADLVAINRDVQFSFREGVEPVYRELVDLLLKGTSSEVPPENLIQARNVIEGLQIAELDNFFREACLDTAFELDRVIDQNNLTAAIVYTIVLPDRVAVVLKLPHQPLRHYSTSVSREDVWITVNGLLSELKRPYVARTTQSLAEQVYDWLIRPLETDLADHGIQTLVFVLDDVLRNIPMAVLHDGQQYLVERYNLALAPGLQISDPTPLQNQNYNALIAGLSEARSDFPPLTYVEEEVNQIQTDLPSELLFNQSFTETNFKNSLNSSSFSIVHIATHGQFSSNAEETFILAWDKPIDVNELGALLRQRELNDVEPVELLVLSACQTAVGDRRATLGLAGMAVRAGARSTIASLWSLDDNSGAYLMSQFYEELVRNPISKAEALRRAQLTLLHDSQYEAPRFWAPYVLLGNWL